MEKGEVTLRDFVSLTGPQQRITLYRTTKEGPELIYTGYRADLIRQKEIMEAGYTVNHFTHKPEFSLPGKTSASPIQIKEEDTMKHEFADVTMKIVCDIYIE